MVVVGIMSHTRARSDVSRGLSTAPVYFVYHVPKCAGRTIDRHLDFALPKPAYFRTSKRRGLGRFVTRYDRSRLPDPRATKVVSGHYLGISLDPLFGERLIKRSILLRDPASHFVSYYNYRMMRYIAEGLQPYGAELAYGAMQRNFITHYILRNFLELSWSQIASLSDGDKYELTSAFLSTFWFVGDYRLCNDFIAALGDRLDIAVTATPHNTLADLVRSVGWVPLTMDRLPPRMIADIRAENAIDQKLWETWRDVRHDTAAVEPRPFQGRASSFIRSEASRFVNQILRRMHRRWGSFEQETVPVMQGDTATPI